MRHPYWHTNKPAQPDPTRAARPLRYVLIEEGKQGQPPRYAADMLCDDGEVRTVIVGPEVRRTG